MYNSLFKVRLKEDYKSDIPEKIKSIFTFDKIFPVVHINSDGKFILVDEESGEFLEIYPRKCLMV